MNTTLSDNLRRLRLEKKLTQEQAAQRLNVSAQSVSRWETGATFPDVMLLPQIARLYGVTVDDLFREAPRGYDNLAKRLLAVYEQSGRHEDFLSAAQEFDALVKSGSMTADDWRSYGVLHEYMLGSCLKRALAYYEKAMELSRDSDVEMYHRTKRQQIQMRCRIGQGAECIAEQEAAVQADPGNAEEWADLAAACFMAGRYEQALKTCCTALEQFPEEGLLHVFAGDSCRKLKRYDEAFAAWEAAIRLDGKFLDAMYSMAFCHEELGQYEKACAVWENIVQRLMARGLDVEAQWPRDMADKCRRKIQ